MAKENGVGELFLCALPLSYITGHHRHVFCTVQIDNISILRIVFYTRVKARDAGATNTARAEIKRADLSLCMEDGFDNITPRVKSAIHCYSSKKNCATGVKGTRRIELRMQGGGGRGVVMNFDIRG